MRLRVKKSRLIVVAALSMVLSCASAAFAQRAPVAGGYVKTPTGSAEVAAAARFAVREQGLKDGTLNFLDSIQSAEVQVVKGRNYRLSMKVWASGDTKDVRAIVYKNLEGEYSLSSWEVVGTPTKASFFPQYYSDSPLEQLMKAIDDAYGSRALGRLDARRPYLGKVRIEITHSLAEDGSKDQYEIRTFRTLAQAERWLKSREVEGGLPVRETRPLWECANGRCDWDFNGGILHNHLYLQQVTYVFRRGRPYIKTISLLDGD
ncbi:MAG: hypothetical protein ICV60_03315 [Pyrinomonadaceae bacterium]|nr:hypothetical protein [Pyrinomonadaceae bacterium]